MQGDHWINGALTDVKDFEKSPNFSNGFPIFPKNSVSSPSPSTDNGTSNLITLLVKISGYRKSSLIFFVHQRGVRWYTTWNSAWNSFVWQLGRKNCRTVKEYAYCMIFYVPCFTLTMSIWIVCVCILFIFLAVVIMWLSKFQS